MRDPCAKHRQTAVTRRQHLVRKVQLNGLVGSNYQHVVSSFSALGAGGRGFKSPLPDHKDATHRRCPGIATKPVDLRRASNLARSAASEALRRRPCRARLMVEGFAARKHLHEPLDALLARLAALGGFDPVKHGVAVSATEVVEGLSGGRVGP